MDQTMVEAVSPSARDAAVWATRIRENRDRGLETRTESSEARGRSSRWLNESTALTVDLLRTYGTGHGPWLDDLKDKLKEIGIKIPPGGEVPNAVARAVLGGHIDKQRVSRVARAAQKLLQLGVNDVVTYMSKPGQGLVVLADAWSGQQDVAPEEFSSVTVRIPRHLAEVAQSKDGPVVWVIIPDLSGRKTLVFVENGNGWVGVGLLRVRPGISDADRIKLEKVSIAVAHHVGATFCLLDSDPERLQHLDAGYDAVLHVGASVDSVKERLPANCWVIGNDAAPIPPSRSPKFLPSDIQQGKVV